PPTLISFACADGKKANVISPEFKEAGNKLYLYNHIPKKNGLPDYNNLTDIFSFIFENIKTGNIVSVKTVKSGGVAVALAKMSFGNRLGANVEVPESLLLSENVSSFIIECKTEMKGSSLQLIGEVKNSDILKINGLDFNIKNLLEVNTLTFEDLFPTVEGK